MEKRYDIFELSSSQIPRWVASARTLRQAKKRTAKLARLNNGAAYVIRDFYAGVVVAHAISANGRNPIYAEAEMIDTRSCDDQLQPQSAK